MRMSNAVLATLLNVLVLFGIAHASTNGYINCENIEVYKQAPLSTTQRDIAGSLSQGTVVSVWQESFSEYLVTTAGGLQGYVTKFCVTLGELPPAPTTPSQVTPSPQTTLPKHDAIDCSKVSDSQGCATFNEMMAANDKGLQNGSRNLVCFMTSATGFGKDSKGKDYSYGPSASTEDKFYLITLFSTSVNDKNLSVFYEIFENGNVADYDSGTFTNEVQFSDKKKTPPRMFAGTITADEMSITRKYVNLSKSLTTESLTIRAATGT